MIQKDTNSIVMRLSSEDSQIRACSAVVCALAFDPTLLVSLNLQGKLDFVSMSPFLLDLKMKSLCFLQLWTHLN